MQLKDIRTFVVGNPPPHFGGRWFVFVKLTTNDNVSGIGESYGVPFDPDLVARMLEDVFGRYLVGQDPHDIEALWRRVYSSGFTQHPDLTHDGRAQRARNGVLGHHRQGGRPAGLQAAGRAGARAPALLHLHLSACRTRAARSITTRRCRPSARTITCGRASRRSNSIRWARTAPSTGASCRSRRSTVPSSFVRVLREAVGSQGRSAVRYSRADDGGRRDSAGAPARALRSAVVRGAGAAGQPGGDGAGGARDHDTDCDRRAAHDQVRLCAPAAAQARPRFCR